MPRPPSPTSRRGSPHTPARSRPPPRPRRIRPACRSLSIVVMVVGSRGDVQPFIPIARRLAERHRVRVATHREFRPMVEQAGLEFYPLAGDPHADDGVHRQDRGQHPVPTRLDQIWEDVPKKRAMIAEILASTWRACTEADPEQPGARPFRADAIVANPPSYGHIHCAEALHIPLHMIFTMPWTATCAFPHPFANIDPGRAPPGGELLLLRDCRPARLGRHRRPGRRVPHEDPGASARRPQRWRRAPGRPRSALHLPVAGKPGAQAPGVGPPHRAGELHRLRAGAGLRAPARAARLPRRRRSADLRRVRVGRRRGPRRAHPHDLRGAATRRARAASSRAAGPTWAGRRLPRTCT